MKEQIDYIKALRLALIMGKSALEELTPSEREELSRWREEGEENDILYQRLMDPNEISESIEAFSRYDAHAAFSKVKQKKSSSTSKGRVFKLIPFMRYAAAVVLPILAAGLLFYFVSSNMAYNDKKGVAAIHPGANKAMLFLTDGTGVDLSKKCTKLITEKDGTEIGLMEQQLTYKRKENLERKKDAAVVEHFNTVITPRGGEYHLVLSDGTRVWLNAASRLRYPVQFKGKQRRVELEGEAYFEVSKNAKKPFIVSTKKTNIKVLGTCFNVNAYEDEEFNETTLVEGSVQLLSKHREVSVLLRPGDNARLVKTEDDFVVKQVDTPLYTAWKDGKFVFDNEPLDSIMRKIARWYDIKVFYTNSEVKKLRFSARLKRYEDLNVLLEVIDMTQKVKMQYKNKALIISCDK